MVLDRENSVSLTAYRLHPSILSEPLDEVLAEFETSIRQLIEQAGGFVEARTKGVSMAGRPGLRLHASGIQDETPVEHMLIYVLDDTTEYELNCQHTEEKAAEIERGCEQIVRTFRIG